MSFVPYHACSPTFRVILGLTDLRRGADAVVHEMESVRVPEERIRMYQQTIPTTPPMHRVSWGTGHT